MLHRIFNFKNYNFKYYNLQALLAAFMLSFIGLTVIKVVQEAEDQLYEKQILGMAVGILASLFLSLIDYHFLCKFYIVFYLANMGLLVLTRLFGYSHYDAQRWLDIPGIGQIQPSEFTKFFLIVFIAAVFNKGRKKINKIWFLIVLCAFVAMPLVLILIQPDLSTTIALFIMFACMVFLSGLTYKVILPLVAVAIPACAGVWWYIHQDFQRLLEPYQLKRILALENPELYPDLMYQQDNAMIAIRAGGLTGKLTAGGDVSSLSCRNLPAIESDFIFTLNAESYGFVGSAVIIGLIVFFVYRTFRTSLRAGDYLGMLLAGGIGSLVAVQSIINICVNLSVFPNTGIPFPFMSAGLSSLFGNYILIGLLMNVSLQTKERTKAEDDF